MSERRAPAPAWLAHADEECPHCEHPYAHEDEARCAVCDSAVCPLCVAHHGKRTLCPDCAKRR